MGSTEIAQHITNTAITVVTSNPETDVFTTTMSVAHFLIQS